MSRLLRSESIGVTPIDHELHLLRPPVPLCQRQVSDKHQSAKSDLAEILVASVLNRNQRYQTPNQRCNPDGSPLSPSSSRLRLSNFVSEIALDKSASRGRWRQRISIWFAVLIREALRRWFLHPVRQRFQDRCLPLRRKPRLHVLFCNSRKTRLFLRMVSSFGKQLPTTQ